jgi:hypothetical protein
MARNKVFISYSRTEKQYLEELLPVLRAVRSIDDVLWFDEQEIDIGDRFHDCIQQALAATGVGILLVSNRFFTSDYIKRHELPYLVQQAEQSRLKLGCLYATSIPDAAFEVAIEIDGQPRMVNLKDYLGAHSPNEPLDQCDPGLRASIYTRLANWVDQQLSVRGKPRQRHLGPRFELAITLRARRDHWEHRFSLPHANDFTRPELDCLSPEQLFACPGYDVDGEDLFQLLFGSDTQKSGEILAAAFAAGALADPTRYPLRVHLLTDEERLYALPWVRLSYQGRRLADDGWTIELHPHSEARFPEYPPHTCYFPGKVVLAGAMKVSTHRRALPISRICSVFFCATGRKPQNLSWLALPLNCGQRCERARPGSSITMVRSHRRVCCSKAQQVVVHGQNSSICCNSRARFLRCFSTCWGKPDSMPSHGGETCLLDVRFTSPAPVSRLSPVGATGRSPCL